MGKNTDVHRQWHGSHSIKEANASATFSAVKWLYVSYGDEKYLFLGFALTMQDNRT